MSESSSSDPRGPRPAPAASAFPVSPQSCNRMQPAATPRNLVQQIVQFSKTKPNSVTGSSVSEWKDFCVPAPTPRACNPVQPDATPRNRVQPIAPFAKTNPTRPVPPSVPSVVTSLTPRQLAAARLLALGRTIPQVAEELKVARTTVWRWQTTPAFRAELGHLHRWLAGLRVGTR